MLLVVLSVGRSLDLALAVRIQPRTSPSPNEVRGFFCPEKTQPKGSHDGAIRFAVWDLCSEAVDNLLIRSAYLGQFQPAARFVQRAQVVANLFQVALDAVQFPPPFLAQQQAHLPLKFLAEPV